MAKHCFELPPTAEATAPGFTARLNDVFRRIQEAVERLAGGKATGDLDMGGYRVVNLGNPRLSGDAVPLGYVQRLVAGAKATTVVQAAAAPSVSHTLLLAVPGVLAIQSDAAPLVTLGAESVAQSVEALVKRAPEGADLKIRVMAGEAEWAAVTIADGETSAEVAGVAELDPLPADTPIVLEILEVGTTFPGADLSVLIRFHG